jgi:hypothetical protein
MERPIFRVIRAPFFVAMFLVTLIPATFICAAVSVGAWFEDGLRLIGVPPRRDWIPLVFGIMGYLGLGIVLPAYLGSQWLGAGGAIMFPVVVLIMIAWLDRW